MKLKQTPELATFLSTYFSESEPEADAQTVRSFIEKSPAQDVVTVAGQLIRILQTETIDLEDLGMETNRWFSDIDEARAWLLGILNGLQEAQANESSSVEVKDSNGTLLVEGDAVQVIKDLKVKGGSSDLKRGTLIKNIHLIEDAEVVECRVEGSTLVLKTCFLKKV